LLKHTTLLSLPEFEARINHHDRRIKNILIGNIRTRPTSKNTGTNPGVRRFANIVRACVGGTVPRLHHSAVPSSNGVNSVYCKTVQILEN
jgi:hypothetical protein